MDQFMQLFVRLVLACEKIAASLNLAEQQKQEARPQYQTQPLSGMNPPSGNGQAQPVRRKSDISDISYVSPEMIERNRAAMVTFSINNQAVPWSDKMTEQVMAFEREFDQVNGPGAHLTLPWRVVERGGDAVR